MALSVPAAVAIACRWRECWKLVASALCVAMHAGGMLLFTTATQEREAMPRKQMNIGLTLEQRNRVDAVSAAEGTTPTEFARAAILEAVQLHHALTAEEREQVALAAEAEGLSLTAFCRAAILEAAAPAEHGAGVDADGVGFLAWLMAVLSATRRGHATRA